MQGGSRPASASNRPTGSPAPRVQYQINTQTKVLDSVHGRILCIADIRGRISALNDMARDANAVAVIHTGDFGFFESSSLGRINDRTLRHLTMYSPLIPAAQRNHLLAPENPPSTIRSTVNISMLSEFPLLLSGQIKLQIPVYTVWGACEDIVVVEKFRAGNHDIENLHVLDEATTRCLDLGGIKLRLLGLGGALVPHKMFDNGDGNATIAGGQGTMWTTALQIGELVDTAQRVHDHTETRLLVTHASPGREGIIAQLALVLRADLTISAGLHFRYASSYNEFSVQGDFQGFRKKLLLGKENFDRVWESVKNQVDTVIDENQRVLLDKALAVVERVPSQNSAAANPAVPPEDPAWKNCWNWNLCDAAYGSLVLDVREGRVSAELKSQGFNYAYRRTASNNPPSTPGSSAATLPSNNASQPPTKVSTPAPDRSTPPHLTNSDGKATSVMPQSSGKPGTRDFAITPEDRPNGSQSVVLDRGEKERLKRERKKEKKERERADKESIKDAAEGEPASVSGKNTPISPVSDSAPKSAGGPTEDVPSPVESNGARTPTSRKPSRNPWTLFMRMQVGANETEIREFYGEHGVGIIRVSYAAGKAQKIAFVEFGDEEAMRAALGGHAETLNGMIPEVKQAADRDSGFRGRGGQGGRGRFFSRGLAAAGLTKPSGAGGNSPQVS